MSLNTAPLFQQFYREIPSEVYLRYEDGLIVVHPVEIRDALGTSAERPGKRIIAKFPRNGLEEGMYNSRILDILTSAESHDFTIQAVRDRLTALFRNGFRQ